MTLWHLQPLPMGLWRHALPYCVEVFDKRVTLFNREYQPLGTYKLPRRPLPRQIRGWAWGEQGILNDGPCLRIFLYNDAERPCDRNAAYWGRLERVMRLMVHAPVVEQSDVQPRLWRGARGTLRVLEGGK